MGEKKQTELWKIQDVVAYLKMPRSTVYQLVAEKVIPSSKIGKHVRFFPSDVEAAVRKLKR